MQRQRICVSTPQHLADAGTRSIQDRLPFTDRELAILAVAEIGAAHNLHCLNSVQLRLGASGTQLDANPSLPFYHYLFSSLDPHGFNTDSEQQGLRVAWTWHSTTALT